MINRNRIRIGLRLLISMLPVLNCGEREMIEY